jgi:hypothetical protein
MIFFSDQRGDPAHDVLLNVRTVPARQTAAREAGTKRSNAPQ